MPTEAEVQSMLKAAVELLEETRKFGNVNAENWVSKEDTLVQALEGDGPLIASALGAISEARSRLASTISGGMARRVIGGIIALYMRHIVNRPGVTNLADAMVRLREWFLDNTVTVKSRVFSFGTPTADGSNVGNGTILRLTKDDRNYDLEAQHADAKRAFCSKDGNSGVQRHEEEFTFMGQTSGDALQIAGSGLSKVLSAKTGRQSLLHNPSFDLIEGTEAVPTDIPNWTSSVAVSATTYTYDSTNYYRTYFGVSTPRALNIKTTCNLTQKLTVRGTKLRYDVPYLLRLAYNRTVGSAAGTLALHMGAVSNNVVLAAQSGWNLLYAVSSPGQNNWLRQFNEDDLDIKIDWTRTSGDLLIDDVLFVPFDEFDGSFYSILGATTPFQNKGHDGDFWTWTDTETGAIIQNWLHRAGLGYLPHSGSPSITDP